MNNKSIRLIRLIYGIAVGIMTVISGLLLMAACVQIYRSGGEQIYTPEKVAEAFAPIALPIYITLVLIVGSFLLNVLLPAEKKRTPAKKQYALLLRIAYKRADLTACEPDLIAKIQRQKCLRRLALGLQFIPWIVGAAIFLPIACNPNNYHADLTLATDSIVAIAWWLLPCALIPTICSIFAAYYSRATLRCELELVKLAPKMASALPVNTNGDKLLYARLAILVVALVAIIGGYLAGGTADVLAKAVAICTECVGLG